MSAPVCFLVTRAGVPRALATLVLLVTGCSLFGPTEHEVYVLVRINGRSLPAAEISINTTEGSYEFQIIQQRVILSGHGRTGEFSSESDARRVWNGVPADSVFHDRPEGH